MIEQDSATSTGSDVAELREAIGTLRGAVGVLATKLMLVNAERDEDRKRLTLLESRVAAAHEFDDLVLAALIEFTGYDPRRSDRPQLRLVLPNEGDAEPLPAS